MGLVGSKQTSFEGKNLKYLKKYIKCGSIVLGQNSPMSFEPMINEPNSA